jgi:hypothetical protein
MFHDLQHDNLLLIVLRRQYKCGVAATEESMCGMALFRGPFAITSSGTNQENESRERIFCGENHDQMAADNEQGKAII